MKRTDLIISKIVRRLKTLKVDVPRTEELLQMLDDAQLEIAQRGLAIKGDVPFLTEAGKDVYDLGTRIFRIRQFFQPDTWKVPVEIVNNEEKWNEIVHSNAFWTSSPQPLFATVWDERLRFWPAPITTGEQGRLWLYSLPTRLLNEGTDPECGLVWDNCLEFNVLDTLIAGDWTARYMAELERLQAQSLREILSPVKISHWSEIGF